ncbi:MAG: hypothetical protein R6V05_00145, partial [Candidatus Brocadiia bacterium]
RTTAISPGSNSKVRSTTCELEPGEIAVVREGPPASRAYVVEVLEREPASREDFAKTAGFVHTRELNVRQRRELDAWMSGLLDQSQPGPEFTG